MEKNSFKVSAELLQKNAMKASIRDLNAEFQMKGGKVTPSKKGDTYQLFHPDIEYLEEFKIRLLKELGLIEEKDVPKELQKPQVPPPRYGDTHKYRPGWNVRSDREIKQGIHDPRDRRPPEGTAHMDRDRQSPGHGRDRDGHFRRDDTDHRKFRDDRRESQHGSSGQRERPHQRDQYRRRDDRRPYGGNGGDRFRRREDHAPASHGMEDDEGIRTFEERWGEIDEYLVLIREALEEGAVDDGQIIKFAYTKELDEEKIKKLKKLLWDNRCRGQREKCPHGKKKLRFEDMMKVCSGKVEGWEKIDSPFVQFLDLWLKNIEKMYGRYKDQTIEVEGKISSYKPVYRKGHEHLKILIYDTKVSKVGSDETPSETRKFWIKISLKEFNELLGETEIHLDDVIRIKGTCIYDKYFYDYWVVDLKGLEIIEEGGGEVIASPQT